jgi:hypothetical protein
MGDDKNTKNVLLHVYQFHYNYKFTNHIKNMSKNKGECCTNVRFYFFVIGVKMRDDKKTKHILHRYELDFNYKHTHTYFTLTKT